MTPVDRLIVALDVPPDDAGVVFFRLNRQLGVTWFKVGATMLIEHRGRTLVENMQRDGARLMLDLKVYDVPSTVQHVVRAANETGVELLTVHMDCVYTAMRAKFSSRSVKILAVGPLTSAGPVGFGSIGFETDGLVCHPRSARFYRTTHGPEKLIVCPGIRPKAKDGRYETPDDHIKPMTAAEAIRNGADMIVVGRPITQAADPVAAARAILEEIDGVTS
jgi:orotidine-5'-phosphate decarboxylase